MTTLKPLVGPEYLPGRHVKGDLSDYDPGDKGVRRCFKCLAVQEFSVGPRGGLHLGPWRRDGRQFAPRVPRCPTKKP